MKPLKPEPRRLLAQIVVRYPDSEFVSDYFDQKYRKYLSGLISKGFISSRRSGPETRIYRLLRDGKDYAIRYGWAEIEAEKNSRVTFSFLCNGWISPVHHQGMPGKFISDIFVGKRITATIDDEETIITIKEGLAAGFTPEFWVTREIKE